MANDDNGQRVTRLESSLLDAWGANGCSNSDYLLGKTTCCGLHLVLDTEIGLYYSDAADPEAVERSWETECCPGCGQSEWDFVELSVDELETTPWDWARRAE